MTSGKCSLCHSEGRLITSFFKSGKGYKYPKEIWQNKHPFSPSKKFHREKYDKNNRKYKDKMLAIEMTTNGLPYTYWQDFLTQSEKRAPAKVVAEHLKKNMDSQLVIWSFGYAMDSNNPLGWYESKTPLYLLKNKELKKIVESEIIKYIQAANKIGDSINGYLSISIRMAWFEYDYDKEQEKKKDKKPDPFYNKNARSLYDPPIEISKSFYNNTETRFYELVKTLYDIADKLTDQKKADLRSDWYEHIKKATKDIFNHWAFTASIQTNPRRISKAHNQLTLNLRSRVLKHEILGLPKEATP